MRRWLCAAACGAVAAVMALGNLGSAETCRLELRKLEGAVSSRSIEAFFHQANPQSFFMQLGDQSRRILRSGEEKTPPFAEVIQKEPAKYLADEPLRGVVKLGGAYYGLVIDGAMPKEKAAEKDESSAKKDPPPEKKAEPEQKKAEPAAGRSVAAPLLLRRLGTTSVPEDPGAPPVAEYNRLYFDANHNGDLTDDPVIEARAARHIRSNYAMATFPPVSVALELEGKRVDYLFMLGVTVRSTPNFAYANGTIRAAGWREGEITLDGQKWRVVVVDGNSNGRFDDPARMLTLNRATGSYTYPQFADWVYLVDPETKDGYGSQYDPTTNPFQHPVGKWIQTAGGVYDLTVSPGGDTLTLEPSAAPVGRVTNPNTGYRALVFGEQGVMKIASDASGEAPLPAGAWRLYGYTIDKTKPVEPAKPEEGEEKTTPEQPKYTRVSGRVQGECEPIAVAEGKSVALPFGPPYEPEVSASPGRAKGQISLGLVLFGAGGDRCSGMAVEGRVPPKPTFIISTEDGTEVDSGSFDYG